MNGTWDSITANWWVGGTPATYAPGDIVTFDDSAAGNFTVSGNASPSSVTVNNSANNYTLSGIIGGAGTPLLKSGTALLTLSGANTYIGTTTINDGTLEVGALANGSLGSGGLLFASGVLQDNGTFTRTLSGLATAAAGQVSGITGGFAAKGGQLTLDLGAAISLNTGGFRFGTNFIFGSATADSLVKLTSNIDFGGANRNITVNPGTGGDAVEFSGVASNGSTPTLAIIKGGAGVLILSDNSTNTGANTINAGTLRAAHNNAFGTGTVVLGNTDAVLELANGITINRALIISNTGDKKTLKLQSTAAAGDYAGTILISETTALNFEFSAAASQVLMISGKISGTAGGAINKTGAGTAKLTGANDYTTPTVISGGVLLANTLANAGRASSIGAATDVSTNLVLNGGTLRHDAANVASTNRKFALGLTGGTLDASAVAISDIVNFSTTLAMGFNSQLGTRTLTLTGSNPGDNILNIGLNDDTSGNPIRLVKEGARKWLITGAANDYTGNTTVNAGTLVLADNAGLKFLLTNSTSNQITGAGTVLLNGDFTINTAAVTLPSGSWTPVNTATLNEIFQQYFHRGRFDGSR